MRLGVGVEQGHLDAERLQLLLDGDRRVLVVLRRVVADLHVQRIVGPVAELCQDCLRLVLAVELRHVGIVGRRGRVALDARRHHAVGRDHRVRPDLLGQEVAVDGHGDGVAKLDVAPRLLVHLMV